MYIPLEEGEQIVAKVHRHWLFIALRILALVLLFLAPSLLVGLLESIGVLDTGAVTPVAVLTLWALWALMLWVVFWQFWTTYYMDVWVVTNRRIIDIDYIRLFDRNIAMLRLERVQDVTTRVQGVVATLLKFGSVIVQTAGSEKEFVIDQISDPEALRDTISRLASASGHLRVVRVQE